MAPFDLPSLVRLRDAVAAMRQTPSRLPPPEAIAGAMFEAHVALGMLRTELDFERRPEASAQLAAVYDLCDASIAGAGGIDEAIGVLDALRTSASRVGH